MQDRCLEQKSRQTDGSIRLGLKTRGHITGREGKGRGIEGKLSLPGTVVLTPSPLPRPAALLLPGVHSLALLRPDNHISRPQALGQHPWDGRDGQTASHGPRLALTSAEK